MSDTTTSCSALDSELAMALITLWAGISGDDRRSHAWGRTDDRNPPSVTRRKHPAPIPGTTPAPPPTGMQQSV